MLGSLRVGALIATSLLLSPLIAQVSFGGRPIAMLPHGPALPTAPVTVLPVVDAAALLNEDHERQAAGYKGPFRFGYNHAVDLGTEQSGIWSTLRNGDRVWRLSIECPEAFSINFRFDRYVIPDGAKVFVYNDAGKWFGAFTAASSPGHTSMGVSQMPGTRITIEYHEPASVIGQGELHIDRVTHAYRDVVKLARDLGESGACNINVICPEGDDWRDQIRSVAIITTGGSGFCTGTLLNNCALDSTPYFLTANHCVGADVADWVFRFNWDSPTCDPTEDGPIDQTVSGCTLLVNSAGTDVAFVELSSIPPDEYNVFYSGWDKSGTTPDTVCGIHHPSGDIKKISHSYGPILQTNIDVGNGAADCWQVTVWDVGTTEPGSSGSGLWNQDHLLIGQLYGGAANCANSVNDYYGRFDVSWPLLEQYLGTCGDVLPGLGDELEEPTHYDAAVTSIVGIPPLLCGATEIAPQITLKNNGDVVLTAVTISYALNGGALNVYAWTGSLQPLQTVNVTLPAIPVPPGNSTLVISSSAPNGLADEVIDNDMWQIEFTTSTPPWSMALNLTLDNYGSDITWTLASDQDPTILYSGGPYPDLEEGMLIDVPWCLTNGCYIFTINDAFGDGICCAEGDGGYVIMDADSTLFVESDGQYTDQEVNIFCIEGVGIGEGLNTPTIQVFPNPVVDQLTIRSSERIEEIRLMDAVGRVVYQRSVAAQGTLSTVDVHRLAPGVYTLAVMVKGQRVATRIVVQR
ncbi:MAG: T9SS type A sorting domain-containing protein [Flavobacteriales bacterium]|nr:T9SS type A sorting domain-containing protein [Flavobacteriales bacterium]